MSTDYYIICTECGHYCACISRKAGGVCINKSALSGFVREHLYCNAIIILDENSFEPDDYVDAWINREAIDSDYYDKDKDKINTPSNTHNKDKKEFKTYSHQIMETIYLSRIKELEEKINALNHVEDLRKDIKNSEEEVLKYKTLYDDMCTKNKRLTLQINQLNKQLATHDASIFEAAIQERLKGMGDAIENPPVR